MINVHNRIFTMVTNFTNCWIDKMNWLIEHYIHLNNTSSIKYLSFTLCHVISSVALQLFHAVTWYQINKMKELAADVDITEVVFCSHTVGVTWKWEISIHACSVLDDNCEIHNCNLLQYSWNQCCEECKQQGTRLFLCSPCSVNETWLFLVSTVNGWQSVPYDRA